MEKESVYNAYFGKKGTVIFDLDGTIYREWDYLSAAYLEIGREIENKFGIPHSGVYQFLKDEFLSHGRSGLFNKLVSKYQLPDSYISEALYILRHITLPEKMSCYQEIKDCLEWLTDHGKQVFIVTNGNMIQQKNKIKNINFGHLLHKMKVIYADEIKPKPDAHVFIYLKGKFNIEPEDTLMIGDSSTDEEFAAAAGIDFIHVNKFIPGS